MAVLVQTGGKIKITPTDYEQLINYTMLYDEGIENINWIKHTGAVKEATDTNTYGAGGSITKNNDHILLTKPATRCNASIVTEIAINFSEYSRLHFKYNTSSRAFYGLNKTISPIQVWRDEAGFTESDINILNLTSGDFFETLEISQYAYGNYYASFGCYDINTTTITLKLYNVVATKSDDITTLCEKAGISAPTSLDTLLLDTASLTAIFNSEDAVKFMVKQCTGDFMVGVLNNANAVALLKASPYLNTVIGNPHWAKFIMMIPTAQELLGYSELYDEGTENVAWKTGAISGGTVTKGANAINYTATNKYATIVTTEMVDFTDYEKVLVACNVKSITGTPFIDFRYSSNANGDTSSTILSRSNISATGKIVPLMDVSELTGTYYLSIQPNATMTSSTAINVDIECVALLKADNWQTWASLGGVTATDLATLLSDSTKMATLMANEEACKYLMGCTGDLMVGVLNSTTAVTAITNNSIATTLLTEHPVWKKFIDFMPVSVDAGLNLV